MSVFERAPRRGDTVVCRQGVPMALTNAAAESALDLMSFALTHPVHAVVYVGAGIVFWKFAFG